MGLVHQGKGVCVNASLRPKTDQAMISFYAVRPALTSCYCFRFYMQESPTVGSTKCRTQRAVYASCDSSCGSSKLFVLLMMYVIETYDKVLELFAVAVCSGPKTNVVSTKQIS